MLRRHDHLGGWCVTELTDVPWELNGLFDLERRPKPAAVEELAKVGQPVLPMLELSSLVVPAGGRLTAPSTSPTTAPLPDVTVQVTLAGETTSVALGTLHGWSATTPGSVDLPVPSIPGPHGVLLRLVSGDRQVATNNYPIRAVTPAAGPVVDIPAREGLGQCRASISGLGYAPPPGAWASARRGADCVRAGRGSGAGQDGGACPGPGR